MQTEVYFAGGSVGKLDWEADARGVQVDLDCTLCGEGALLRCYGEWASGAVLRIGLPAPKDGRLRLRRRLSRETLKTAGCPAAVPQRVYLAAAPEPPVIRRNPASKAEEIEQTAEPAQAEPLFTVQTGDTVLDALLTEGVVQIERVGDVLRLSCPFASDRPFALAPAFVLCSVRGERAELRWEAKGRSPETEP